MPTILVGPILAMEAEACPKIGDTLPLDSPYLAKGLYRVVGIQSASRNGKVFPELVVSCVGDVPDGAEAIWLTPVGC